MLASSTARVPACYVAVRYESLLARASGREQRGCGSIRLVADLIALIWSSAHLAPGLSRLAGNVLTCWRQVVACFSTAKTARLACVNKRGVVEGVVTLTDLFKYLAGC